MTGDEDWSRLDNERPRIVKIEREENDLKEMKTMTTASAWWCTRLMILRTRTDSSRNRKVHDERARELLTEADHAGQSEDTAHMVQLEVGVGFK